MKFFRKSLAGVMAHARGTAFAMALLLLTCAGGTACAATAADVSSAVRVAKSDGDKDVVVFLKTLYGSYVFGGDDFSLLAHKYCTDRLREQLAAAYDYDCPEGEECYATWLFRSGAQDGPSDECRLKTIVKLKHGWYRVKFVDMGIEGSVKIKFVRSNGVLMMDQLVNENVF